jgi:hypothetical protein
MHKIPIYGDYANRTHRYKFRCMECGRSFTRMSSARYHCAHYHPELKTVLIMRLGKENKEG